jgi:hypothetical protein
MNSDRWEFPPGFEDARAAQYSLKKWNGAARMWRDLDLWRNHDMPASWRADFEAWILVIMRSGEPALTRRLIKALESEVQPEPEIDAILATIEAFEELFSPLRCSMTQADWPTKRVVRLKAEEILKDLGYPIPGNRHWTKIFIAAGLSELPKKLRESILEVPTRVYYLRVEVRDKRFYKIGVTSLTVEQRFVTSGAEITVLKIWDFKKGAAAYRFESAILRDHAYYLHGGEKVLFTGGNTELFTRDVLGLDRNLPCP